MGREALNSDTPSPTSAPTNYDASARGGGWWSLIRGILGVVLFLAAIRLLGEATGAASEELSGILAALDDRPLSALGGGWLVTYVLTNGSVVAALGVTLAGIGAADPVITVALVSGSRLGAAAFVVMVGMLDHLRRGRSLRSGVGLGLLTFVVSHGLYIPATLLSWGSLSFLVPPLADLTRRVDPAILQPGIVDTLASDLVDSLGPIIVAGIGLVGLFAGVSLFDRALRSVNLDGIREKISLNRRWLSFLGGLVVTGVTSSVAFSIGVLVPLFNRRAITRKEVTPYVLGANVTTLIDTYVVALVLRSWEAAGAVLGLMLIALALSILYMAVYTRSFPVLDWLLDGIVATKTTFVLFLVSLVVAPILLLLAGMWI